MRCFGITYDTGFIHQGATTRETFDPAAVTREMRVIRTDLHCAGVRVTGGDLERIDLAARHAAEVGLEVWFSPFTCDLTADALLALIEDSAERAERLRRQGANVVLLVGSELSLFNFGFLPGDTVRDRMALLSNPHRLREVLPAIPHHVNSFLRRAVDAARARFGGPISYASLPFEGVDWTPFDFIATDAGYRSVEIAAQFRDGVRTLVARGKPVAITEFGCTTHQGAANLGARGDTIVEWGNDGRPKRLKGNYIRDEQEQSAYLLELLDIFAAEGVDTVFANTFARYDLPHRSDPSEDFDLASYGVVKVLDGRRGTTYPDMQWEPKAAFATLAAYYRGLGRHLE